MRIADAVLALEVYESDGRLIRIPLEFVNITTFLH
jgi:hypothetical protein